MEAEINKLKQEYISTKIPEHLELHGVEDILSKIDGTTPNPQVHFFRPMIILAVLLLVFLGGLTSAASFATPSSPLYSVKKLGEKIAETAHIKAPFGAQNTVEQVNKNIILTPTVFITPPTTPTLTPTPTKTRGTESKKDINSNETKESNNKEKETNNSEVKGASTNSEDKSTNSQEGKTNSSSSEHSNNQNDSHSQNETDHENQSSHQNENGSNNSGKDNK